MLFKTIRNAIVPIELEKEISNLQRIQHTQQHSLTLHLFSLLNYSLSLFKTVFFAYLT